MLVGPICRSFTDKVKVSRESWPTSWTPPRRPSPLCSPSLPGALIIGLIATFYTSTGYNGNPQVASRPVSPTVLHHRLHPHGAHHRRHRLGLRPHEEGRGPCLLTGKLYRDGAEIRREIEQEDLPEGAKPSIWNMLVPVIVLLVFIFVGLFYTGDIKTNGFFGALANSGSLRALDTAFILASIAAIIMGMISKVWNFKEGPEHLH